jgi:hypothetical protein
MAKYDMSPHIRNLDNFVGWIFIRTVTREAEKNLGDGGKFWEQFPGMREAHKAGEIDISLTIQGVEVDFVDVMNQVYAEYRKAVADDSRTLAKTLISDELSDKIDLIKDMLDEVESKIAEEIPEDKLANIREWHSD